MVLSIVVWGKVMDIGKVFILGLFFEYWEGVCNLCC